METCTFLEAFLPRLRQTFGSRIWFCGLQGSRARGENRPDSDVDMVVILDELTVGDIHRYRKMLDAMPGAAFACGFLGGRRDLAGWLPADLVSLCLDTVPLIGEPEQIMRLVSREAAWDAVWTGACSIYHGCVHNMLYSKSEKRLRALLKEATFVLRAAVYAASGIYPKTLEDVCANPPLEGGRILSLYGQSRDRNAASDFEADSALLFAWVQAVLRRMPPAPERGMSRQEGPEPL